MKITDFVLWTDVPNGALVQGVRGTMYVRVGDRGWCVGDGGVIYNTFGRYTDDTADDTQPWCWQAGEPVVILARGLTGEETKEELSAMAARGREPSRASVDPASDATLTGGE